MGKDISRPKFCAESKNAHYFCIFLVFLTIFLIENLIIQKFENLKIQPSATMFNTPTATSTQTPARTSSNIPVPGTPMSHSTSKTRSVTVPVPRSGGVYADENGGEAWGGGSNIDVPQAAVNLGQRRPAKYSSAAAVQELCKKGISYKLGNYNEKSDVSFTLWIETFAKHCTDNGMDTVFRIPNSTWTKETFILEEWGKATETLVDPWVKSLKTGVNNPFSQRPAIPCSYDRQSLEWSAASLLSSLSDSLKDDVVSSVGVNSTGPQVFVCIITKLSPLTASLQRNYIKELEKLDVTQEEGENIINFNKKVREKCKKICNVGPDLFGIMLQS